VFAAVLVTPLSVLGVLPSAGAHADTVASLPITGFYQIVADAAHGHLFISQGLGSGINI
jgi:hypothetical protein